MPQRTSRQPWAEHKSTALGRFCCKTIFGAGTKNGFLPPRAFYEKVDDIQRWRDMQHTCTVGHRRSKRPSMRLTRRPPNAIRRRFETATRRALHDRYASVALGAANVCLEQRTSLFRRRVHA